MNFYEGIGFQSAPLTLLQKSWFQPDEIDDGGQVYLGIVMIDEVAKSEQTIWVHKPDFRELLLAALQRNDVVVKAGDAALFDTGRARRAVVERLYPDHDFGGKPAVPEVSEDGSTGVLFRKSERVIDPVKRAYKAFAADGSNAQEDLRRAAQELDDLVEQQRREGR